MEISFDEYLLNLKIAAKKFYALRQDDKFCDVTLCSGDAVIKAHRVVLAANCRYFEEIFTASQNELVNLSDVSPDVLPLVVDFLYAVSSESIRWRNRDPDLGTLSEQLWIVADSVTGRRGYEHATVDESTVQQLMAAADKLGIGDLVNFCARYLKTHLDSSNALEALSWKGLLKNNPGIPIGYPPHYMTAGTEKERRRPSRSTTAPVHLQLGRPRLCKWMM
ncbi:Ring canal kelch protein [Eumeta japonica]|uniref:Ring canal kelch protein n=1 Tax=Eumeta variegata TaxID=151549 RepID=A0A4C1XT16_EUMVA|nr:Ring canal kelch protein [Eumeta japonica]